MKKICFFGVVFIVFCNFISCSSVPQKEVPVEYRSLIINADDLCQNRKTNEAILKCYNDVANHHCFNKTKTHSLIACGYLKPGALVIVVRSLDLWCANAYQRLFIHF